MMALRGVTLSATGPRVSATAATAAAITVARAWQGGYTRTKGTKGFSAISVRGNRRVTKCLCARVVEVLQEFMSRELDFLVSPLGRTVLTGNQAHPMDAPKVPIYECVSSLGVVAGAVRES